MGRTNPSQAAERHLHRCFAGCTEGVDQQHRNETVSPFFSGAVFGSQADSGTSKCVARHVLPQDV